MSRRERGFTLVEVMAVLVLGGVFMGLAAGMVVRGAAAQRVADDAATVARQAMGTLADLEHDIRTARTLDTTVPGELSGTSAGGAFAWRLGLGSLRRDSGGAERVVLDGVAAFEVRTVGRQTEVVIRYAERPTGGTPPPIGVVVSPRATEGER